MSKVTALTAITDAETGDILYIVDDPTGSAASRKITKGDLLKDAALADGSRDFTAKVSYSSHPTFSADTEIVDKKYVDDEVAAGGGGGSSVILDLGDDGSNESTDLSEIATTGDANNIFTEPSADKLLIAVGNNWPTADVANALATDALDAITEIASALKSGSDGTLVTGTAGTNGNLAEWNADGDVVDGPDVLDEDDMASDSATAVATQQSIKAYADLSRTESETASFTVSATHLNKTTRASHATGMTVTLPSDTTDNLTIGFKGVIKQVDAGQITFDDDSGAATIRKPASYTLKTAEQWSSVYYEKVAADTWEIIGDLESETTAPNAQTGTSYTLALDDAFTPVTMDNGSANTATIPANSATAFDIGVTIPVWQKGAGTTTVQADTGVTLNGVSAGGADISNRYHGVVLLKVGTDEWFMTGDHGTVA